MSKAEVSHCKVAWGGWAPGASVVTSPSWAGRPIGKAAGVVAFAVNIHYDNIAEKSGIISRDGLRLYYTPTLRPSSLASFGTMTVSANRWISIPPGKKRFFMTRSCDLKVFDR